MSEILANPKLLSQIRKGFAAMKETMQEARRQMYVRQPDESDLVAAFYERGVCPDTREDVEVLLQLVESMPRILARNREIMIRELQALRDCI